jgi:hypothetical protein
MNEQEFVKKAQDLTVILLKEMAAFTKNEEPDIAAKLALLTLSKMSSSIIHAMENNFETDAESILDLFVSTVIASVELIADSESSSKRIINKMMGKSCD